MKQEFCSSDDILKSLKYDFINRLTKKKNLKVFPKLCSCFYKEEIARFLNIKNLPF